MWTYCQLVSSRLYCKDLFTPQYVWELLAISSSPSVVLVSQHWLEICWICASLHLVESSGHLL